MAEKETQTMEEEVNANDADETTDDAKDAAEVNEEGQAEDSKAEVNPLEAEVADLTNRLIRVQADYDNFRRRSREEREAAAKYRAQSFIEGLLPVIDNFERALLVRPEQDETKSLLQGMEMVYRQLQDMLKNEGVEVIETVGQVFDPHLHQAVMQVEEEGFEPNQIVEELQKGYKLKDRVLRPSMVKVNA